MVRNPIHLISVQIERLKKTKQERSANSKGRKLLQAKTNLEKNDMVLRYVDYKLTQN